MIERFGARAFEITDLDRVTFAQAAWLFALSEGLDLEQLWRREGESEAAHGERLRFSAIDPARVPELLAGYLVPEGQRWSREGARSTVAHLEQVTDQDEQARLMALAGQVMPDFFGRALAYRVNFLASMASASPEGLAGAAH